jgi:NTP pyrophosphatase (non-canonical NTP hydrolase)
MTPKQFVTDAIRTESRIEKVTLNPTFFSDLTGAIIALGSILDQIKKHTFYNKPYNIDKIKDNLDVARTNVLLMSEDVDTDYWTDPDQITDTEVDPRIFHAIVGIATEAVELLQALRMHTREFDNVNFLEELGDVDWYQAIGIDAVDGSFEQVLERVIAKLRIRYPDKFTSENAINRDLAKERKVLEGSQENP